MSAVGYIQANLVPALALVILLANARRHLPSSRMSSLFQLVAALALAELVIDTAVALVAGGDFPGDVALAWALNTAFYLLGGLEAFCWFLYVHGSLRERDRLVPRGWKGALAIAPFLVYGVLALTSPWTHLLFTVDEGAAYARGPLFASIFVVTFGYLLAASAEALGGRRGTDDPDLRRRCYYLAAFCVPAFVAGVLQVFFGGLSLLVPGLAVSVLLVYLDLQRTRITQDALTGLGNRGRLDACLRERCARGRSARPWCLVIVDIDEFKAINDSRGHTGGDRALRFAADALRRVFGQDGSLVARYGGDEFAVVLEASGPEEVEGLVSRLEDELASGPGALGADGIRASAGYAFAPPDARCDPDELVERADKAMYRRKLERKTAR